MSPGIANILNSGRVSAIIKHGIFIDTRWNSKSSPRSFNYLIVTGFPKHAILGE
jgi:hypothetical protein